VSGCPQATFLRVAETILANSGRDRTTSFAYAVAWTQHTNGPQTIGCCALLQLLLGNIGRPGAGVMALRGHASIQGSTDMPTLYHSIHGYMTHPSALKAHGTLRDWLLTETSPRGYMANTPRFMVSYLKSMYGAAATAQNDFGYDWHPKVIGDHSHLPMFVAMNEGRVKGMLCVGQNPATSLNASVERKGLGKLEWLVVKDNWLTETATFWKNAPEVTTGQVRSQDIQTEVFFFPAAQVAEYEGSFTNTQRMLQWHYKASDPPGDCRTDLWLTHQLARRLKTMYANSTLPRDQGFRNLVWDFDSDDPREPGAASRTRSRSSRTSTATTPSSRIGTSPASATSKTTAPRPAPRGSTVVCSRRRIRTSPRASSPILPASPARSSSGAGRGRPTGASSTIARPRTCRAGRGASARSGCGGTAPSGPAATSPTSRRPRRLARRATRGPSGSTRCPAANRSS